jgi:DNA polymerase-3 subunit gamma/tau
MVTHLHYVAEKEHIQAEENALHIIAQKADGAMRDALSIFDQLVSFSGNDLKYSTVLENLNVLDYDYYFRITNQILGGDVAGTLLTIDDIISKGFDGQHFLTGFGEHLRNLLVCKDPSTVRLMETAPSIKALYLGQAAQCDARQLLSFLDINNRCDITFKSSNNKRLHLELALMQMALSAKQPSPSINLPPPAPKVKPSEIDRTFTAKTVTPVKIRDLKAGVSGMISIKQDPKPSAETSLSEDPVGYGPSDPFSQEQLLSAWKEYVLTLKEGFPHLYNSLEQFQPIIRDEFTVVISLENKLLETDLSQKKTELLEFLRAKLSNHKINVTTVVEEHAREHRPYTDKDKFSKMAGKNPALLNLKENLDLEIEY